MAEKFDISIRDSQTTSTPPITPEKFDLAKYQSYEKELLIKNKEFVESDSSLLVYRRFRPDGVFYDKCRDYKESLNLQLGALNESMKFKADIANFLEPWYGIGYIASAFGGKYVWEKGSAPSVPTMFSSCDEILNANYKPLHESDIGRHILETTEYFLDKTKGILPMSFCDVQSPINMLSYLIPIDDLFLEMYDDMDSVIGCANLVSDLLIEFLQKQEALIGDALAKPGHGFASSRVFDGVGASNDNSIMISSPLYRDIFKGADEKLGDAFGGICYHSCGNWASKIDLVKTFKGLMTVDGAFSPKTDPSPNDSEIFGESFSNSGIVLNARAVGGCDEAFDEFKKLWVPKQKLIAVTYCETPAEQEKLYDMLHQMKNSN